MAKTDWYYQSFLCKSPNATKNGFKRKNRTLLILVILPIALENLTVLYSGCQVGAAHAPPANKRAGSLTRDFRKEAMTMVIPMQIDSFEELQALQRLACQVDEDVFLHAEDNSIMVDAKSFIGLFTLDFSKPVYLVTESPYVIQKLSKCRV